MEQKGSFIGFTFGNRHSSKMGIFRISQSKGHRVNLLPRLKEEIGEDRFYGSYHYNTSYDKQEISIPFAYFGLTEEQLLLLRKCINDKKLHNLILDEEPYKVWFAKLTGTATINHTSFEVGGQRFYHGEGEFTFTAYYPYAKSRYQYLEDYTLEKVTEWIDSNEVLTDEFGTTFIYPAILECDLSPEEESALIAGEESQFKTWLDKTNFLVDSDFDLQGANSYITFFSDYGPYYNLEEWRDASKIPSIEDYGQYINGYYKLYNAGDFEMPFKIYFPIEQINDIITLGCGENKLILNGRNFKKQHEKDRYLVVDSRQHLVYGCDSKGTNNKSIYNKLLIKDNFFNLPLGEVRLESTLEGKLEFSYLYL